MPQPSLGRICNVSFYKGQRRHSFSYDGLYSIHPIRGIKIGAFIPFLQPPAASGSAQQSRHPFRPQAVPILPSPPPVPVSSCRFLPSALPAHPPVRPLTSHSGLLQPPRPERTGHCSLPPPSSYSSLQIKNLPGRDANVVLAHFDLRNALKALKLDMKSAERAEVLKF